MRERLPEWRYLALINLEQNKFLIFGIKHSAGRSIRFGPAGRCYAYLIVSALGQWAGASDNVVVALA